MKGINYAFTLLIFLCASSVSLAQSDSLTLNELSVEVFDVVTREPLRDYGFLFINEQDTLKMHIDSVDIMKIDLDEPNHYVVTIFKDGYDTLSVDFDTPTDSSKTFIHFYVPKEKLTREEKRLANYHSRNLPPSVFDKSPCFDKVKMKRGDMLTMRFFLKNSGYMESTLDYEKLRDY